MDQDTQRRLARNEMLFREANEAIERGQWPGEPGKIVRFRCECSRVDCGEAVEASLPEYEHVRRFPSRFLLAHDHELPEVEVVVGGTDRFVIVEKINLAGEVAAANDPRA